MQRLHFFPVTDVFKTSTPFYITHPGSIKTDSDGGTETGQWVRGQPGCSSLGHYGAEGQFSWGGGQWGFVLDWFVHKLMIAFIC